MSEWKQSTRHVTHKSSTAVYIDNHQKHIAPIDVGGPKVVTVLTCPMYLDYSDGQGKSRDRRIINLQCNAEEKLSYP